MGCHMKHVVCGICRVTGLITTREVEAADADAAAAIASGDLIVFEVDPAEDPPAPVPPAPGRYRRWATRPGGSRSSVRC